MQNHDFESDEFPQRVDGEAITQAPTETATERTERHRTEFLRNPEPRVPCLLLIDTSMSMTGEPIDELNAGLHVFQKNVSDDELAAKRVEVAIVSFGGEILLEQDFTTVQNFQVRQLVAKGCTPMSGAILHGIDMIAERRRAFNENGVPSYRPWIFLLTDGAPTDMDLWPHAVQEVRRGASKRAFEFFAIGVGEAADMQRLKELSTRPPARLRGLQFGQYFEWLGTSMRQYSRSRPGDSITLPPANWSNIQV